MLPELENSDRTILASATVSIWEVDYSWCKAAIDDLKKRGVTEFRRYFESHSEFLGNAFKHIKVLDLNQASLTLFDTNTKKELITAFERVIVPETYPVFMEALVAIADGRKYFESEAVLQTLQGRRLNVHATISFPEAISKFDHVLVTLIDITSGRHLENVLRYSEERFRKLADNAPVMIWMSGADKLCTWFNRHWLDFVGRPMARELGNGWAENVHPDDLHHCLNVYTTQFDNRESFCIEYRLRRQDGTWRWVMDHGTPNYTPDREFIGYMGSCTDITESKQAVANYLEIFEKANDAIYVYDLETWLVTEVNQRATEISGYSKDEIINGNPFELMAGSTNNEVAQVWHHFQLLGKSGRQNFEWHARHKKGHYFWIEVHLYKTTIGGTDRILAFFHDINARKQAEQKIQILNEELEKKVIERTLELEQKISESRETEEKFQKAFQASAAGITISRIVDGSYVDVNKAFIELTEYSKDELLNYNSTELEIILNPRKKKEILAQVRENGSIKQFEVTIRCKSGTLRDVLASIETILLNGEKFAITIMHDITERNKAAMQLKEANEELESFSHSISHDLRGPLRTMIGYSQLLEEDFGTVVGQEGKNALQAIQQNGLRMYGLIDGLLELSISTKREVKKSEVNAERLVQGIINEISADNNYRANVITKALFPAYADPVLLTQVWSNLVSNALKYSSNVNEPIVEIGSWQEESEVVYYVKDNGAGFDMQYAGKLFGVFQRLHKESEFSGCGIGLSIVKRIISRHEGRVWAEGKVNKGATFYFSLPAK